MKRLASPDGLWKGTCSSTPGNQGSMRDLRRLLQKAGVL